MDEIDPNRAKKEIWFVIGGYSLIMAGLFVFLPIWVAIGNPMPIFANLVVIFAVLSGLTVLGWTFMQYRWAGLKKLLANPAGVLEELEKLGLTAPGRVW